MIMRVWTLSRTVRHEVELRSGVLETLRAVLVRVGLMTNEEKVATSVRVEAEVATISFFLFFFFLFLPFTFETVGVRLNGSAHNNIIACHFCHYCPYYTL